MTSEATTSPICFCGSETEYNSSTNYYHGMDYGMRWICKRWPKCLGSVGAHPDGRPLGTVPTEETKKLRMQLHTKVDGYWVGKTGKEKNQARRAVYVWLSTITGIPFDQCHIAMFNADQCRQVINDIVTNPYI